jgi:deoxyribonuclease V
MTVEEALDAQIALARRVRTAGGPRRLRLVAGAVARAVAVDSVHAAAVVLSLPDLVEVNSAIACQSPEMPYRPGFRAFHDGPALLAAIRALTVKPDVVLFHGHGIAHPRGIGLASHLGVVLDVSTIGCADSPLVGEFEQPGLRRGEWSRVCHSEQSEESRPRRQGAMRVLGAALRTRAGARPLLVSPGHRISVERAVEIILACSRFHWPEPLRAARRRVRAP